MIIFMKFPGNVYERFQKNMLKRIFLSRGNTIFPGQNLFER